MDVLHAPQTNQRLGVCFFWCNMQAKTNQTLQPGSPEQMKSALVLSFLIKKELLSGKKC